MNPDAPRQALALVRSYSYEVEERVLETSPSHNLALALVREQEHLEERAAPWRALFGTTDLLASQQDNPITEVIARDAQRLKDIWRDHQATSTPADRLDLDKIDPTPEGITSLIRNALASRDAQRQDGRWNRAKGRFHSICGTLDSHKAFLSILPQSSEYVSIFAGSITAIIQASVNHEGIAEDIAEALCSIDQQIQDCSLDLELYKTDEMRKRVADLYAAVFAYLASVSTWLTQKKRKHFVSSFNEDLRQEYQDDLAKVKSKADRVKSYAAQSDRRAHRIGVEWQSQSVKVLEARIAKMEANQMQALSQLGTRLVRSLESQSAHYLYDWSISLRELHFARVASQAPSIFSVEDVTEVSGLQSFYDGSEYLQAFYDGSRFQLPSDGAEASIIPQDIIIDLDHWLKTNAKASSRLWLRADQANFSEDLENPMSMIAAKLVNLTQGSPLIDGSPLFVVSYFCHLERGITLREGNLTKQAQASVALAYAILAQCISVVNRVSLLEPQIRFDDLLGISPDDIFSLDGSMKTGKQCIGLLESVVRFVPPGTLCVVDALHCLDHRQTELELRQLVGVLRPSRMKVLFTTSGRCAALVKEMSPNEVKSIQYELF